MLADVVHLVSEVRLLAECLEGCLAVRYYILVLAVTATAMHHIRLMDTVTDMDMDTVTRFIKLKISSRCCKTAALFCDKYDRKKEDT